MLAIRNAETNGDEVELKKALEELKDLPSGNGDESMTKNDT